MIVLRSEGTGAFCAGASFAELSAIADAESGTRFFLGFANLINAMRECPKLILARVHGKVVGGGVGMVARTHQGRSGVWKRIAGSEVFFEDAARIGPSRLSRPHGQASCAAREISRSRKVAGVRYPWRQWAFTGALAGAHSNQVVPGDWWDFATASLNSSPGLSLIAILPFLMISPPSVTVEHPRSGAKLITTP